MLIFPLSSSTFKRVVIGVVAIPALAGDGALGLPDVALGILQRAAAMRAVGILENQLLNLDGLGGHPISTHTPAGGRPQTMERIALIPRKFLLTPPDGGDQLATAIFFASPKFLFTPPCALRDNPGDVFLLTPPHRAIQGQGPHAYAVPDFYPRPRAGAIMKPSSRCTPGSLFLLTPPQGGDLPAAVLQKQVHDEFLLTPPQGGDPTPSRASSWRWTNFYSRPRRGAIWRSRSGGAGPLPISTHAPAGGRSRPEIDTTLNFLFLLTPPQGGDRSP